MCKFFFVFNELCKDKTTKQNTTYHNTVILTQTTKKKKKNSSASGTEYTWLTIGIASFILFVCLLVALAGAAYFTKVNVILLTFQFLGVMIALLAILFRERFTLRGRDSDCSDDYNCVHYAFKTSRFDENWYINHGSFQNVFGVIFPAVTGIMEGANLSGDLADPAKSIPLGTLGAQGTSIIIYLLLIVGCAGCYDAGLLRNDYTVMQETAWGDIGYYLVIIGVLIATSSSALGSLFGGSRVMQAIARDKLFPYVNFLSYGAPRGDEPRVAVLFTWFIAQCLVFIGNLDDIATLSTCFFCLSYATVNFSCFLLEISGTPNFRPNFRYYSWHTALFGMICNVVIMFYVDYEFGLAAIFIMGGIFIFLTFRAPKNAWGDVTQSVIFHQVRKYLLRLDERKAHSKLWRPSILLFVDTKDLALIDFCNNLKKGGLYVLGCVLKGDFGECSDLAKSLKREWIEFCDYNNIKAFPQICVDSFIRNGYENLLLLAGLGAMQPNTIVMPMVKPNKVTNKRLKKLFVKKKRKKRQRRKNSKSEGPSAETSEQVKKEKKRRDEERRASDTSDSDVSDTEFINTSLRKQISLFSEINPRQRQWVVESPAVVEYNEYVKLIRNIMRYKKNLLITHNFDQLDFQLVVSQRILENVSKHQTIATDESGPTGSISREMSEIDSKTGDVLSPALSPRLEESKTGDDLADHYKFTHVARPLNIELHSQHWVDAWLFADDYTFIVNGVTSDDYSRDEILEKRTKKRMENGLQYDIDFPMLMMQLAHIILLNRKWSNVAKLRVFLVISEDDWSTARQQQFDFILNELRLGVEQSVVLKEPSNVLHKPTWDEILNGDIEDNEMILYWKEINRMIKGLSSQTLFSFIKLPKLPPMHNIKNENYDDEEMISKMNELYLSSLYVLLNELPPCALVATGESIPVISVDI